MTTPIEPSPFAEVLHAMIDRHRLTGEQLAVLLGVPWYTVRNWLDGVRQPTGAAVRLVEVYLMIEALAPDLYQTLLPPAPAHMPRRGGKRNKKPAGV